MSYVLTLVSSDDGSLLSERHFKEIGKIIKHYNLEYSHDLIWLRKDKAAEITISEDAQFALISHLSEFLQKDRIDFFVTKSTNRQKRLLLADMDSTIVSSETLDELAEYAGLKDKIAKITALAMEGKLDFHQAIKERVSLLKGLSTTALSATLAETKLNDGAKIFVRTMRENGAVCVLVSGGFTFFTHDIGKKCGFQFDHGNTLEIQNGYLTGRVIEPILDKYAKVNYLENYMEKLEIPPDEALTIGDGANDIPMLKAAGLGIGYHPKDAVKQDIKNCILYGDLTAALYAQGYEYSDFHTE